MYAWVFKAISGGFNDYSSLSLLTSPPVEEQINRSKVDSKKKKKKDICAYDNVYGDTKH